MPISYVEHNKFTGRTQDPPSLGSYLQPSSDDPLQDSFVLLAGSINLDSSPNPISKINLRANSSVTQSLTAQSTASLQASYLKTPTYQEISFFPLSALLDITVLFQANIPLQSLSTTIDATQIKANSSFITADRT